MYHNSIYFGLGPKYPNRDYFKGSKYVLFGNMDPWGKPEFKDLSSPRLRLQEGLSSVQIM